MMPKKVAWREKHLVRKPDWRSRRIHLFRLKNYKAIGEVGRPFELVEGDTQPGAARGELP
eukprot:1106022-Amphidinium_carterae.1